MSNIFYVIKVGNAYLWHEPLKHGEITYKDLSKAKRFRSREAAQKTIDEWFPDSRLIALPGWKKDNINILEVEKCTNCKHLSLHGN